MARLSPFTRLQTVYARTLIVLHVVALSTLNSVTVRRNSVHRFYVMAKHTHHVVLIKHTWARDVSMMIDVSCTETLIKILINFSIEINNLQNLIHVSSPSARYGNHHQTERP